MLKLVKTDDANKLFQRHGSLNYELLSFKEVNSRNKGAKL